MSDKPNTLPAPSFPVSSGRLVGAKPIMIRGVAMTVGGAMLLLIAGHGMLVTREAPHGAVPAVIGVALLIPGVRTLRKTVAMIKLHIAERRALKRLQRKLHPDWKLYATFFQDAPVAVITSPAGGTWNVAIRCFARTRVERKFFGLGSPTLKVQGDSINATSMVAATFSLAHGGQPMIWYPSTGGATEVFGGEVPIVSGDADKLLNACGGRRDGFVKSLVTALRKDAKESCPGEQR
ncbi:hypothetical protein [Burkholderia gladioli]|uniref:hypothetical protein n=1 Tax=Burkholderia gladioli TaxID=28095 RepID=UPI0011D2A8C8|nr:hypothetical protein [Burkholderia gladioli]